MFYLLENKRLAISDGFYPTPQSQLWRHIFCMSARWNGFEFLRYNGAVRAAGGRRGFYRDARRSLDAADRGAGRGAWRVHRGVAQTKAHGWMILRIQRFQNTTQHRAIRQRLRKYLSRIGLVFVHPPQWLDATRLPGHRSHTIGLMICCNLLLCHDKYVILHLMDTSTLQWFTTEPATNNNNYCTLLIYFRLFVVAVIIIIVHYHYYQ